MTTRVTLFTSILSIVTILTSCSSNNNDSQSKENDNASLPEPREIIHTKTTNFVKSRYAKPVNFYEQESGEKFTLNFEADSDETDFLIGNFNAPPLLPTGELYQIDFNNDGSQEYLCVLGLSPGLSWQEHILLFDADGNILDSIDINTKEGICHVEFRHLQSKESYNLICEWQQSISAHKNTGIFAYNFDGNAFNQILNENLTWEHTHDHYRGPDNPENVASYLQNISYKDRNNDGIEELVFSAEETLFNGALRQRTFVKEWDGKGFMLIKDPV